MNRRVVLYDAFSGMNLSEKGALIKFLLEQLHTSGAGELSEAIDYALKNKPSFGGFISVVWEERKIIAAMVVNKTGMEGFNPKYLIVYAVLHRDHRKEEVILHQLIQQAIDYTKGDMALHLKPDSPALPLFQKMGFEASHLELRLPAVKPTPGLR